MNTISSHFQQINLFLLSLAALAFLIKIVLYLRVEKEWDPVRFLHYSKIDLKMTSSKNLRSRRRRQNQLSRLFLTFILLFGISTFFLTIISG